MRSLARCCFLTCFHFSPKQAQQKFPAPHFSVQRCCRSPRSWYVSMPCEKERRQKKWPCKFFSLFFPVVSNACALSSALAHKLNEREEDGMSEIENLVHTSVKS